MEVTCFAVGEIMVGCTYLPLWMHAIDNPCWSKIGLWLWMKMVEINHSEGLSKLQFFVIARSSVPIIGE